MIPRNIMTFWWFLFGDQPGLTFEGVVDSEVPSAVSPVIRRAPTAAPTSLRRSSTTAATILRRAPTTSNGVVRRM